MLLRMLLFEVPLFLSRRQKDRTPQWRQCVLGSAAVTVAAGATARGNEPAFVKREVQNFGGRHAATPLSSGGHPGDSSPFPHQRATSFPRNGQLLQEIPAQCPDELGCDKKWSERLEWLVAIEAAFAAAKQTLLSATHLASHSRGSPITGPGCLADAGRTSSPWDSSLRI